MNEPKLAPPRNVQLFKDDYEEILIHALAQGCTVDDFVRICVRAGLSTFAPPSAPQPAVATTIDVETRQPVTPDVHCTTALKQEGRIPVSDFELSQAADDDIPFDAGQSYTLSDEDMRRWENPKGEPK